MFDNLVAGKRAQVMGDLDVRHSCSYTPDVARGLVALGAAGADVEALEATVRWAQAEASGSGSGSGDRGDASAR